MMIKIKKIFQLFSSLKLTLVCLLLLCVYLVWGTFYQVDHGVHAAQERFFTSWILLIKNVVPVPGVLTVLAILSVNLLFAGLKVYMFRINKFGILLMHVGSAILLIGSGMSSTLVNESSLSLAEGEQASAAIDFANWVFKAKVNDYNNASKKDEDFSCEISSIKTGKSFKLKNGTLVKIEKVYKNCSAYGTSLTNLDSLQSKPISKNRLENIPGIIVTVSKKEFRDFESPKIRLYGGTGYPTSFLLGSDTISLSIQPRQADLPVNIGLIKFSKENHPGTNNAKSYESRIHAQNSEIDRDVVISMNKPFRYKNFTFYQSGYTQDENGRSITSLSVVENPVRLMPYVAGTIIMVGLLFHFIIKFIYACRKSRAKK